MAKVTEDPWAELDPPDVSGTLNARRVDAEITWDFFWARSVDGSCLLLLRHSVESAPQGHLPVLRGIDVSLSEPDDNDTLALLFRLSEPGQRELFHRLCCDIVACTAEAESEGEAVGRALNRTWRWHHLLRGGPDSRLSVEEQKGLIGELLVIERYLLPTISPSDVMASWTGPLGTPKDFEIGGVLIEAKARRGAAEPYVAISSEHQLDVGGSEDLFLHVVDLERAPADTAESWSVADVVARMRDAIEDSDPAALCVYESLIAAAGFRWTDDFSEFQWVEGESRLFAVTDEFPRIRADNLASGVTKVRYSISLVECDRFRAEPGELTAAFGKGVGCDGA